MAPPLVKSTPTSLAYKLLKDQSTIDQYFLRLKRRIYEQIDKSVRGSSSVQMFRESGRLAPDRAYFYIKPRDQSGWLFERTGIGWLLSRATKIPERNLFLRDGEPLDSVCLFRADGQNHSPRVSSQALGHDYLSFPVYELRILHSLGLEPATRQPEQELQ